MTGRVPASVETYPLERVLEHWKPEPIRVEGSVDASSTEALAHLIGAPAPSLGDELRVLWHEVLLREPVVEDTLGPDGHPASSGLIPPISDRQRMFGGGRVTVLAPLRVGDRVVRTAAVTSAKPVQARSGAILVVRENHRWFRGDQLCIDEERDIVYRTARGAAPTATSAKAGTPHSLSSQDEGGSDPVHPGAAVLECVPTSALLRDYSALTANAHRIHHDVDYARRVEGHQGLLVHGPLTALLAAEAFYKRVRVSVTVLDYRLTAPAHVGELLALSVTEPSADGRRSILATSGGRPCLRGTAAAH